MLERATDEAEPLSVEEVMRRACADELLSHHVYRRLARAPFVGERLRMVLERAAEDELRHYKFWERLVGKCAPKAVKLKALVYALLFYLFGATVTLKVIESKEVDAAAVYREVAEKRPDLREELERIVEDEERHEEELASNIDEGRVKYIGSITLGVSDALVELTGIYTGSLGAFEDTLSAGLTGLLAGVAASISMGVASYAQARHEGRLNPRLAGLYTSLAYLAVVSVLALPYFAIGSLLAAFAVMLALATAMVAYVTFYAAVLHDRRYLREFAETASLMFGVSILLYFLGSTLGGLIGVRRID